MKTSTLVVIGLGAAAVLFFVLKPGATSANAGTAGAAKTPIATARNSRQALERAAVNVGEKLAGKAIDWFFDEGDRTSVADSLSV